MGGIARKAHSKGHLAIFLSSSTTSRLRASWSMPGTATIEKQPEKLILEAARHFLRALYISVAVWYSRQLESCNLCCGGIHQRVSWGSMHRTLTVREVAAHSGRRTGLRLKCFLIFFFILSNLLVRSSSSFSLCFLFLLVGAAVLVEISTVARATLTAASFFLDLRAFSRHDWHLFRSRSAGS